jgi:hypothetical protein
LEEEFKRGKHSLILFGEAKMCPKSYDRGQKCVGITET